MSENKRSDEALVTQGGDWGSHITRVMGLRYPQHCKGQLIPNTHTSPIHLKITTLTNPPKKPSQPHQLHPTQPRTQTHQLPRPRNPPRPHTLQLFRKSRPRTHAMVHARRQRLQQHPTHKAANTQLLTSLEPRRPPRLDLRKTPRLDRRVPVDLFRNPNLGVHLLLFRRRPGRQHAHLLRSGAHGG